MENNQKDEEILVEETQVEEANAASEENVAETVTYDESNASGIDKFFNVSKFGSNIKTEIIAG